jgi:predicted amidophosphoribosyltransferase
MNTVHSNHWRLRQPRYRLLGCLCQACRQPVFPARLLCPECAELLSARRTGIHANEGLVVWLTRPPNAYADQESQVALLTTTA